MKKNKDVPTMGCRFYMSVMSNQFEEILLEAIEKVNTENVWTYRDATSTVYRGETEEVLDCVEACFNYAYRSDIHMTLEGTFSKGCPGEYPLSDRPLVHETCLNQVKGTFPVLAKISFYPMGCDAYMDAISHVIELAQEKGIYKEAIHYVSLLEGSGKSIFEYIESVLDYANENFGHYVFQVTLSVNSPSQPQLDLVEKGGAYE